jgi:NAD(P)H-flavin reductase
MYATWAVFCWGIFVRLGFLVYRNFTLHKAHITAAKDGALIVSVKTRMRWAPGQHVYLRFFAVRPLESHPYSIASISGDEETHEMQFIISPQSGFSKALANKVKREGGSCALRLFVDGPFGADGRDFRAYDAALLLSGGSGIGHTLPVFLDLVKCMRGESATRSRCSKVELIWVIRNTG